MSPELRNVLYCDHSFIIKDTIQKQVSEDRESKVCEGPKQLPCLFTMESGLVT